MTQGSETADRWFGLCRKTPIVHPLQTGTGNSSESAYDDGPGGGTDGSGTMRRGVGTVISAAKTLVQNPQLFWFTLLIGLVFIGNIIGQSLLSLLYVNRVPDIPIWHGLTFVIEFLTVFCLVFLLAGLVLSIASQKGTMASLTQGLTLAGKYARPLTVWSVILALACTVLFEAGLSMTWWVSYPFNIFAYLQVFVGQIFIQFPFNWTLNPSVFITHPAVDGPLTLHEMMADVIWFSYVDTVIISAINLLLFLLTLFVVPLIVLEGKSLKEAVQGSCTAMKKVWGEVTACIVCLGTVVIAVLLMYLLFNVTHAMVTPPLQITWRPGDAWLIAGLLYDFVLFSTALVAATIGGIAALDLYTLARSRWRPESAQTLREVK